VQSGLMLTLVMTSTWPRKRLKTELLVSIQEELVANDVPVIIEGLNDRLVDQEINLFDERSAYI
jgi:glycine cleavage system regulatory protein